MSSGNMHEPVASAHGLQQAHRGDTPRGANAGEGWPRLAVMLALAAILLLGAALRFTGLDWDDGQHLHPDERFLTMVENALTWPASLSEYLDTSVNPLNPYNRGQGSYVYGLLPLVLAKALGQLTGFTGYSGVYLAGRAMSGALDLMAVLVVFALGKRLYDARVGLLGALLLSLSVLNIQQSHYFTVDSATTFLVTLALYYAIRVAQGEGRWSIAGLGVSFGLALASKVSIATFGLVIGLALLVRVFAQRQPPPQMAPQYGAQPGGPPKGGPERTMQLGRWRLALTVDGGDPPESVQRLDALTFRWIRVAVLMFVILFIAFWAFRLTMPQAFEGPGLFGLELNQRWLDDMVNIRKITSGEIDYPPSHQWADRTPVVYMLQNMVRWGLGLPLGLAVWFAWGLMLWQLARHGRLVHLLPWVWMTLTFFYQSIQFVKTVRYLLPIYPTMALMAGYGLVWLWDRTSGSRRRLAPALARAAIAAVIVGTALWALAFTSIYTRPITRIEASRWMYEHIPPGSTVTFEVWDDPLPLNIDGKIGDQVFRTIRTEPYWEDIPEKRAMLYEWIEQADYIVLSSNRLYGSIPRLATRYPMTTRYYEALFSGELGFEAVITFTSRPQLFGIEIVDDDADESFTVYDHPKVSIFRKRADFDMDAVRALFDAYDLERIVRIRPTQVTSAPNGLMLSTETLRTQRQGGTWSEIFTRDSLANRVPALLWWLCLTLLGIVAWPLTYPALKRMPDGGYSLAKILGMLFYGYLSWLVASTGVRRFDRGTLILVLILLSAAAASAAWLQRRTLVTFVGTHWSSLLVHEALFTGAFIAMLLVRQGNPDLWHPAMGGEKPMDLAYLNAIIKSKTFPPYDPWFSGGYINYYYFGWVPIAALIKLTGILPTIGYNLALASLFSFVFAGSVAVAAHLIPATEGDQSRWLTRRLRWGIAAGLLVAVAGNLGEIELLWQGLAEAGRRLTDSALLGELGDVLHGVYAIVTGQQTLLFRPEWWYWNASRVMAHGEINEFPYFSFLYADLHAHVMGMPLFVLAIGLAGLVATGQAPRTGEHPYRITGSIVERALQLLLLGLALGASWCANAWDLPTGVVLAVVALAISARSASDRWDRHTIVLLVTQTLLLGTLTRFLYQPFHAHYGAAYTSVALWHGDRSTLGDLLLIYLPYLFVLVTFLLSTGGRVLARTPWWRSLRLGLARQRRFARAWSLRRVLVRYPTLLYPLVWLGLALGMICILVLFMLGEPVSAVLTMLLALAAAGLLSGRRATTQRFVLLLITGGLALALGIEWVVLKGDIGRMNTVFKFSLQIWILWGIASAVALAHLFDRHQAVARAARKGWWRAILVLLAIGMFSYPLLATPGKVRDRVSDTAPRGLDGMAYMDTAVYADNGQALTLAHDAEAIRWLQDNIVGSPVIAEANTPLYRWGGRISIYTGLPSVIGWDWHQKQQRAALSSIVVDWRLADLNAIYTSPSIPETLALLDRYQVGLLYVGELERAYYPADALAKFDAMVGESLDRVYGEGPVTIYRVLGSGVRLVAPESSSGRSPALSDWLAGHWVPSRVVAQAPGQQNDAEPPDSTQDLLLDVPVETIPVVSARGWNKAAAGSAVLATLCWWGILLLVGLAAWPLVVRLAPHWPDRGYAIAKGLGLILSGYLAWLGASLRWVQNTPVTAWGALFVIAVIAWLVGWRRQRGSPFPWRKVLYSELIFSGAFLAFVLVRLLNPDLWQPWFGGEKMMEIAMLNAVSRSAYLPPYDPYFAGGTLNYYYYGLYLVNLLAKLTGLPAEISYNLAVPTFFALTVGHAYAVGSRVLGTGKLRAWQGACAAALVALVGNLSGAWQYLEQLLAAGCPGQTTGFLRGVECVLNGLGVVGQPGGPPLTFDYWYAGTRIIPFTINEFPFFTFLFADLHPHLMALPFGLLVLALCGLVVQSRQSAWSRLALLAVTLVLTLGMLGVTNTWDLPIYLLITAATLIYVGYQRAGLRGAVLALGLVLGLGLAAMLAYAPFYAAFRAQDLGLERVLPGDRTTVTPFIEIWGLFLWLVAGGLGWQIGSLRLWRSTSWLASLSGPLLGLGGLAGIGAVLTAAGGRAEIWPVLVLLLVSAAAMVIAQRNHAERWFSWLLIAAALGVLLGIEWVYLADFLRGSEWRRMNTVFKFSLQAWVLLGVSLGAMLPVLWRSRRRRRGLYGNLWHAGVVVLIVAALIYPLAAVPARVQERFSSGSPPRNTLDGTAYMAYAVYNPPGGTDAVDMSYDRQAVVWIWEHIAGNPVIAEAPVDFYRAGGLRIASYTGLPTLLGAHQYEQRPAAQVGPRQADAERLFATEDPEVALEVIQRQGVRLVYVGPLERALYTPAALDKFDTLVEQQMLERIYWNKQVDLYRYTGEFPAAEEGQS